MRRKAATIRSPVIIEPSHATLLPEMPIKKPLISLIFLLKRSRDRLRVPTLNYTTMARKCWIERNKRKEKTVAKYAKLRAQLKAEQDYVGLTMLPRDASPTRLVNRCQVTGRRRAYIRRFKLSRIAFRELASHGMIPGGTKSSW